MSNVIRVATSIRTPRKIGIIGTGGLGEHIIKMLLRRPKLLIENPRSNIVPVSVIGSVRNPIREKDLLHRFGSSIILKADNRDIAREVDTLILSVKPGQLEKVCKEITPYLSQKTPIISVAAAAPLKRLHDWLPKSDVVIRCMPNIPCSIGAGIVPFQSTSDQAILIMNDIFAPNIVLSLGNSYGLDASTLISGCGPAFFAWYVECLKKVGEGIIEPDKLNELIVQTMLGTAIMLKTYTPIQIMRAVASPKGATESALSSLHAQEVDEKIHAALIGAQNRLRTIADSM